MDTIKNLVYTRISIGIDWFHKTMWIVGVVATIGFVRLNYFDADLSVDPNVVAKTFKAGKK